MFLSKENKRHILILEGSEVGRSSGLARIATCKIIMN